MMQRLESYGRLAAPLILAAVALWPAAVWAHTGSGGAAGFLSGARHPVSGLDHVLAMIPVGLCGAQLGIPAMWLLPVAFPMMMAFGGMVGLMGLPLPGVEVGIAVSAVVLGVMVLFEARPTLLGALTIVAVFAVFHGHAHGTELPEGQSGLLYSMGFVIATGLLHGVGIGIGSVHRWDVGRVALALGLPHGFLNGTAMAQAGGGIVALLGIATAVFVTVALVAGFVVSLHAAWARVTVRVAGSWIAATGLLMLG